MAFELRKKILDRNPHQSSSSEESHVARDRLNLVLWKGRSFACLTEQIQSGGGGVFGRG